MHRRLLRWTGRKSRQFKPRGGIDDQLFTGKIDRGKLYVGIRGMVFSGELEVIEEITLEFIQNAVIVGAGGLNAQFISSLK